jgi:hypothetical protein
LRERFLKAFALPVKYARLLFPLKNDSLLVNMPPLMEHAVKNEEHMKLLYSIAENMCGHIVP